MIAKTAERFELADNLGKAEGSRRQIVGTRYSYGDYYGEMIAAGIAIPRIHPATDDGTPDGNPVFWTRPTWEEKKKKQRRTMAAQLLQNPLSGKEQMFRVPWLRPYWVRPQLLNVYIMGDPSHGHNKTSDRTAIAVVGVGSAPNKNKYLLDGYCHRMQLRERWERTRDLHMKWSRMTGVQLVKVGWERYGMQSDEDYFRERMELERYFFTIEEINWTGERGGRARGTGWSAWSPTSATGPSSCRAGYGIRQSRRASGRTMRPPPSWWRATRAGTSRKRSRTMPAR